MQASAVRKLEKELLTERKMQRELEEEKEKYADKESFVTGAYKAKMAELREFVEKRREEEAREEVMDITKQDGLGGFYRYMFQQKTGSRSTKASTEAPRERGSSTEKVGFTAAIEPLTPMVFFIPQEAEDGKSTPSRQSSPSPPRHRRLEKVCFNY